MKSREGIPRLRAVRVARRSGRPAARRRRGRVGTVNDPAPCACMPELPVGRSRSGRLGAAPVGARPVSGSPQLPAGVCEGWNKRLLSSKRGLPCQGESEFYPKLVMPVINTLISLAFGAFRAPIVKIWSGSRRVYTCNGYSAQGLRRKISASLRIRLWYH